MKSEHIGLLIKALAMAGQWIAFREALEDFYYQDDLDKWLRSARVSSNVERPKRTA
jgi:hypothetical protein